MDWTRSLLILGLLAALLPAPGIAQDAAGGSSAGLIRALSPELKAIERRLGEIEREVAVLPALRKEPWGSRYGHRSADLPEETTPDWVQMNLGGRRKIDRIALMPVNLSYRGQEGAGYGFPKRFRVEISDYPDMRESVVVVDESRADVVNPGRYPLVYEFAPVAGAHLRLTSLRHGYEDGAYFWAMEEAIILEGNQIVPGSDSLTYSSCVDLYPQWVPNRIRDGQSALGMPVDVNTPSPTQGYLSDRLSTQISDDPNTAVKWCAVDLGQAEEIEQVRLLPLESDAYEVVGGRGFPRRLLVQLANDEEFAGVIWEGGRGSFPLGYPDGCSINILVPKVKARYVRVLAQSMWSRDNWHVFGLSELQVYGSNRNLALGKRAYALDIADKAPSTGWSPAYLVDGFTSRHRLIEWPEYLQLMGRRGQLEMEMAGLEKRRADKFSFGKKVLGGLLWALMVLALAAWILGMIRHRLLRKRAVEQLRQQIARDLHDDIGSNLGGIVLLSEIGGEQSNDPDSRRDFKVIRQAAEDASLSLRDIVWLIQQEPVGLRDFVTRMRQSLRTILNHPEVSMQVEPTGFPDHALGLLFRRHVFLAFKEALNNVRKHARTNLAKVKVEIGADRLRFTVEDEGDGFDPDKPGGTGHGLGNLKRRAERLAGSIHIDSAPGKGTRVTFEAPFSTIHT